MASRWPRSVRWPDWASSALPTSRPRSARGTVARAPPGRRGRDGRARPRLALGPARRRDRRARVTPTPSSSSAPPGSWPNAATAWRCPRWRASQGSTTTRAAGRPRSPRSVRSATPLGFPPSWPRSRTSRRCAAAPLSPSPASTTLASSRRCAAAAADRDWQVRQAAEELLDEAGSSLGSASLPAEDAAPSLVSRPR